MNIDLLIKMANEISEFFAGTGDEAEAVKAVAQHLRRYWEPRMRAQIVRYYEERAGAGLTDIARNAVGLLQQAGPAGESLSAGPSKSSAG